MEFSIRGDDLDSPEIAGLLQAHLDHAAKHSPPESVHALDLDELRTPEITFWSVWEGKTLVGCGALRELSPDHGEIKSMHTALAHRGKGVAARLLTHILKEAKARSYGRVSLETGSMEAFAPARTLYARFGFKICAPFAEYREDPNSVCMTLHLGGKAMPHRQPPGFLAIPTTGKGPGLLVLHAWWGLNDTMKALCGRLAAEGYIAFAPDLYRGKIATTIKDAEILCNGLDEARAKADIADAVNFLSQRANAASPGLGVLGFSLGANFALTLSAEDPGRVRAVVLFYGTGGGEFTRSRASYLGHFAETDEFEPESSVRSQEDALRAAGRPVTFHTYAGTGHWFFEPDRPDAYQEGAARLAWERTLAFLREELPL